MFKEIFNHLSLIVIRFQSFIINCGIMFNSPTLTHIYYLGICSIDELILETVERI